MNIIKALFTLMPACVLLVGCVDEMPAQAANHAHSPSTPSQAKACDNRAIANAYHNQQSNQQVIGCGTVVKVLPDDNKGSRHQKLIVKLDGHEQTLLIAHNIDLAPRVDNPKQGDHLRFFGEYEYNEQGGVLHWTHRDPAGRHQDGWIDKNGQLYQ